MSRNIEANGYSSLSLREQIMTLPREDRLDAALHIIDILTGYNLAAYYADKYKLTERESRIVAYLDQRVDRICSKEAIYAALYHDVFIELKIIDVFVCKIRKKIPNWIITHWGVGFSVAYKLENFVGDEAADTAAEMIALAKQQPRVKREYPKRLHAWTSEEDADLRNMVENKSTMSALQEEFGRTERAIIERMTKLGIRKKFLQNRFRNLVTR